MKRNFTHQEMNRAACSKKVRTHEAEKAFEKEKSLLLKMQKTINSSLAEPSKASIEAILSSLYLT